VSLARFLSYVSGALILIESSLSEPLVVMPLIDRVGDRTSLSRDLDIYRLELVL
jgi:hypothetical protein